MAAYGNSTLMCIKTDYADMRNRTHLENAEDVLKLYWILVPILCVTSLIGCLANAYVLFASLWLPKPVSINLRLCLSLAGMDALTCVTWTLGLTYGSLWRTHLSVQALKANQPINVVDCVVSWITALRLGTMASCMAHVMAIGVNHLFGTVYPLAVKRVLTPRRANWAIALLWLVPITMFLIYFGVNIYDGVDFNDANWTCNQKFSSTSNYRIGIGLVYLLPVLTTTVCYAGVIWQLRKRQKNEMLQRSMSIKSKFDARLVVTMLSIVGTLIICWVPSVTNYVVSCYVQLFEVARMHLLMNFAGIILICVKLTINAVIYALRLTELQYAMWQMAAQLCPRFVKNKELPRQFVQFSSVAKSVRSHSHSSTLMRRTAKYATILVHDLHETSSVARTHTDHINHDIDSEQMALLLHSTRTTSTPASITKADNQPITTLAEIEPATNCEQYLNGEGTRV